MGPIWLGTDLTRADLTWGRFDFGPIRFGADLTCFRALDASFMISFYRTTVGGLLCTFTNYNSGKYWNILKFHISEFRSCSSTSCTSLSLCIGIFFRKCMFTNKKIQTHKTYKNFIPEMAKLYNSIPVNLWELLGGDLPLPTLLRGRFCVSPLSA
jgi:hypothetical protein